MNFELNEQQLSIQKMAREFTEKKVAPKVLERDETREYDVNLYKDLCEMGFIGLPYAKEYGGQGLGYMEYALAVEEISKVAPSLSVSFSVATSLYGGSLYFSDTGTASGRSAVPGGTEFGDDGGHHRRNGADRSARFFARGDFRPVRRHGRCSGSRAGRRRADLAAAGVSRRIGPHRRSSGGGRHAAARYGRAGGLAPPGLRVSRPPLRLFLPAGQRKTLLQRAGLGELPHSGRTTALPRPADEFPGGGRFDAGMLYYAPQIWCSDNTDAVNRLDIQYGTSFFYPTSTMGAHVSAVPNHQTGRITPFATRGNVAMAGTFGYELDLNLVTDEEKAMVKEQLAQFDRFYDLTHGGDYYRLTAPKEGELMVWEFVAKDQSRALLTIVKTDAEGNMLPVHTKVCGLAEDKLYRCSLDQEVRLGRTWNRAGLTLHQVLEEYESIRVEFTEVK